MCMHALFGLVKEKRYGPICRGKLSLEGEDFFLLYVLDQLKLIGSHDPKELK